VPREGTAIAVELMERARVVDDSPADELLEPAGRHLGGELDVPGGEAGAERALDLGVARRIEVEPQVAEQLQDGEVGVRLHGVPEREPEGVREAEGGSRRSLERRAVVDVARGAEAFAHVLRLDGRERHGAQRIIGQRGNAMGQPRPHPHGRVVGRG